MSLVTEGPTAEQILAWLDDSTATLEVNVFADKQVLLEKWSAYDESDTLLSIWAAEQMVREGWAS